MMASNVDMKIERDEWKRFEGEADLDHMAQQVQNPFKF